MEVNYYKRYEPIDGKWYIKELLGEGSYGKVFRIEREDISGKYTSALKIISVPNSKTEVDSLKESLGDEQSVSDYYGEITKKLMQEFQLMSSLKGNSNIVSYEDHDIKQHEDGIGYDILIRMEFSHGVTVVAAAGNDNVDILKKFFSPACINGVVTVAAVADNNQKAKFSNYGNGIIDIAATGVKIGGAARGGGTVTMNGTSMASPHIAGVLALIRSANPNYSSTDAINAMKSSASNLGSSAYYGAGIPNLENLVSKTPVENNITVNTLEAKKISQTNATVYGKISYLGTRPSEVGIYFGNDSNNLNKVASDKINHNKNSFDMWYDLNSEAGQYLSAGRTYYYQCYAIQNGKEVRGLISSFTTESDNSGLSISTGGADSVTLNNATVRGTAAYSGTRPSEVGLYFGTSPNNMNKVARDTISHNKNPFDIWYDLNSEAGTPELHIITKYTEYKTVMKRVEM